MEPKLQKQIKEWNEKLDPESAKRLLIREGAMKAYKSDTLGPMVKETLLEVTSMISVLQMTKAEVGVLIGRLENARLLLASLTQGIQIAYAEEEEPKIRTKRENERLDKVKKASKEKEDLLGGIDMAGLLLAIKDMKASKSNTTTTPADNSIPTLDPKKYICENCKAQVWITMKGMHKCAL